jgi:hypothetical protein
VYVGAFPGFDYIDVVDFDLHDDQGNNQDDEERSQPSGRVQRRAALHEVCRQCVQVDGINEDNDLTEGELQSNSCTNAEKKKCMNWRD